MQPTFQSLTPLGIIVEYRVDNNHNVYVNIENSGVSHSASHLPLFHYVALLCEVRKLSQTSTSHMYEWAKSLQYEVTSFHNK